MARLSASQTSWNLEKSWMKPSVDHPVRCRRAAPQAVEVLEIASVHLGPGGGERRGARVRTGEAEHRVARVDEILNDGGADEARRAGNENTHVHSPTIIQCFAATAGGDPVQLRQDLW